MYARKNKLVNINSRQIRNM